MSPCTTRTHVGSYASSRARSSRRTRGASRSPASLGAATCLYPRARQTLRPRRRRPMRKLGRPRASLRACFSQAAAAGAPGRAGRHSAAVAARVRRRGANGRFLLPEDVGVEAARRRFAFTFMLELPSACGFGLFRRVLPERLQDTCRSGGGHGRGRGGGTSQKRDARGRGTRRAFDGERSLVRSAQRHARYWRQLEGFAHFYTPTPQNCSDSAANPRTRLHRI